MRIAVPQMKPLRGDIEANVEHHAAFVRLAARQGASLIVFPELSLTGYEPSLAEALATHQDDPRLSPLQILSDEYQMTIGAGLPIRTNIGVQIGMVVFGPHQPRQVYAKQLLHTDELPFFVAGDRPFFWELDYHKIAPAICYESLQPQHADAAVQKGADVYWASVAKSASGVEKAFVYFPTLARTHKMLVLMTNSLGHCDDFVAVGQSSIWNRSGKLIGRLNETDEALMLLNTHTEEVLYLQDLI